MCSLLIEQGFVATVKQSLRVEPKSRSSIPIQLTPSPLSSGDSPTCCGVMFDLRERELAERARRTKPRRPPTPRRIASSQRWATSPRSPLNTVPGWAPILSTRSDLDASVQKAVKTIERNARAQAQLISELLDVSRVIAGKLHMQFEAVDVRAVIAAAVAVARLTLDKQIAIEDDLGAGDAYVVGDSTRLQQVITKSAGQRREVDGRRR